MRHRGTKQKIAWHDLDENELTIDNVRDDVDRILLKQALEDVFSTLTDREKNILKFRFFECLTLEETGKRFGITREPVRQVEARALRKLRHPRIRSKLRDFYPECYRSEKLREEKYKKEQERWNKEWKKKEEETNRKYEEYKRNEEERKKRQRPIGPQVYEFQLKAVPVIQHPPSLRKASISCPSQVVLARYSDGIPYLRVTNPWNNIDRDRDPETYDRWLNQLLEKEKSALSGAHQQENVQ